MNTQDGSFCLPGLDLANPSRPTSAKQQEDFDSDEQEFYSPALTQKEQPSNSRNYEGYVSRSFANNGRTTSVDTSVGEDGSKDVTPDVFAAAKALEGPVSEARPFQLPGLGGFTHTINSETEQSRKNGFASPPFQIQAQSDEGKHNESRLMNYNASPLPIVGEPNNSVVPQHNNKPKPMYPEMMDPDFVAKHKTALETLRFLSRCGVSRTQTVELLKLNKKEEQYFDELWQEAGLVVSSTAASNLANVRPHETRTSSQAPISPTNTTGPFTGRAILTNQQPQHSGEALAQAGAENASRYPLPTASAPGSAVPTGRDLYLAKLSAAKGKKAAQSRNASPTSPRQELDKSKINLETASASAVSLTTRTTNGTNYERARSVSADPSRTAFSNASALGTVEHPKLDFAPIPAEEATSRYPSTVAQAANMSRRPKPADVQARVRQKLAAMRRTVGAEAPARDEEDIVPKSPKDAHMAAPTSIDSAHNLLPTAPSATGTKGACPPAPETFDRQRALAPSEESPSFESSPAGSGSYSSTAIATGVGHMVDHSIPLQAVSEAQQRTQGQSGLSPIRPVQGSYDVAGAITIEKGSQINTVDSDAAALIKALSQHSQPQLVPSAGFPNASAQVSSAALSSEQNTGAWRLANPMPTSKERISIQHAKLAAKIAAEKATLAELERKRKAKQQESSASALPRSNENPVELPCTVDQDLRSPSQIRSEDMMHIEQLDNADTAHDEASLPNSIVEKQAISPASILQDASQPQNASDVKSSPVSGQHGSGFYTTEQDAAERRRHDQVVAGVRRLEITPLPSQMQVSVGGAQQRAEDLRKKRRAEISELDSQLSEKRRKLEEQHQALLILQAEIDAANAEREKLASELEELGIDTDGMTHDDLIRAKETLETAQDEKMENVVERTDEGTIPKLLESEPTQHESKPQDPEPAANAAVVSMSQPAQVGVGLAKTSVAPPFKVGSNGATPADTDETEDRESGGAQAATALGEVTLHKASPSDQFKMNAPNHEQGQISIATGTPSIEIDMSETDTNHAAGNPGLSDVSTGPERSMSMTDDSMSVSSGELPDASEVHTEAVATPDESGPVPLAPLSSNNVRSPGRPGPEGQANVVTSHSSIPAAPIRYYDPRDREVLGLTDELQIQKRDRSMRDLADVNPLDEVSRNLQPFEQYETPLKRFKDFRYHQQFKDNATQGFQSPTWSHNLDPNLPLCPVELHGRACNDRDCGYQHFRDLNLKHSQLLLQLGQKAPLSGPEAQHKWKLGLSRLINNMRDRGEQDVETISQAIIEYRREFLRDFSGVLHD